VGIIMSNSSELFGGGSSPKKWVSGTTYQEGNVVWSPSDNQYYMRKNGTTGAGTTDPSSDTTNWQPTGDRAVKSIQRGRLTLNGSSLTATISTVNTAKTELRVLGFSTTGPDNTYSSDLVLTNSTTLTMTRAAGAGNLTHLSWELTERY